MQTREDIMAQKPAGRHRADVRPSILDFELRSKDAYVAKLQRKAELKAQKLERKRLKAERKAFVQQEHTDAQTGSVFVVQRRKPLLSENHKKFRSFLTMTIASGLVTCFSLPAYAFNPDQTAMAQFTSSSAQLEAEQAGSQSITVAAIRSVVFSRGTYKSATQAELARQNTLTIYRQYTGPTVEDFLNNPAYKSIDGGKVLKVASQYIGTPYVFGGESPAGFDCSGFVAFVFSQFGIALPHSVRSQDALGALVSEKNAKPGDLVVFNDDSHDGIYAGNGQFYHAPKPGDEVKLAPIFTPDVHYVRIFANK
jgi:cell wall-associated NlpC family hydrolase